MKIVVDWDRCEANGVCMRVAPESFLLDEKDTLHVLNEQVTPELRAKVEKAVRDCPRQALSLSQSE
ncbi:ferredoxin [Archangium minus]|uniref:Ferredoxin n=2 Tax=Archangium TaxID=47 RepID=A0ABY9WT10_9BACT|nr:ferredoxin [Archangium violaceum]WNG46309.1 ferredoxin [Archangium minus]